MSISDRIQEKLGIDLSVFELLDEVAIQEVLADVLRKKALDHLLRSTDPMAKNFRVTFRQEHPGMTMRDYFVNMGQPGQWATEDEAKALAEMLDFNLDVKFIEYELNQDKTDVIERSVILERYKTGTPDAPTITLSNRENQHWFVNDKTKSLGDCLFDAMAQSIQQLVKPTLMREHTNGSPLSDVTETESIASVDNAELESLKIKIGFEAITYLIEGMQQTSLSEFEAVKLLSEDLIGLIGTEMPNIDGDFKLVLQTAESISDLNIILDDMLVSLKQNSFTRLDMLKEDGVITRDAESKMLKQNITMASSLCAADKTVGDLNQRLSAGAPPQDKPSDDDTTPSGGLSGQR